MNNISINFLKNIKKHKLILLLMVVIILTLSILTYKVIDNKIEYQRINYIKELISEEKYEEAIEEYSKCNDEDLSKHIVLIQDFLALSSVDKLEDIINKIIALKETYRDILGEQYFIPLLDRLNDLSVKTEESLNDIKSKTTLFSKNIEDNLDEAEVILKELKQLYPNEDFSEVSKLYETKKIEAEKKAEEERLAKLEAETNSSLNNTNGGSNLSITDTNAAKTSEQIITVVSNGGTGSEVCRWEKDSNGKWSKLDSTFGYLGSGGMKYGPDVYNWDMCTPTGSYSLTEAFGNNYNPGTGMPYRVLDGSEYWVDDEKSKYYNTMQFGDSNGQWDSAEHLGGFGKAYNYSIVIDYNRWPVSAGGSSAIFLHVSTGKPTWGCVAVEEYKMVQYLNWLDPSKKPRILLGFSYDDIFKNY